MPDAGLLLSIPAHLTAEIDHRFRKKFEGEAESHFGVQSRHDRIGTSSSGLMMSQTHGVTGLLQEWVRGNQDALADLTPLVYAELRRLAGAYMRKERQGHTLQPTALVHEAYMRLVDQSQPSWENRFHFYGVAARLMRQILVDHARRRDAKKRAAGLRVPLQEAASFCKERGGDLIALDTGLTDLEKIDPRKCKAVELRYFGGLAMEDIARMLEISPVTVRRDLRMAEAWLHKEMRAT